MNRRRFLAVLGVLLAGLGGLGLLPSRWLVALGPYRAWVDSRLTGALRAQIAGPSRFEIDAEASASALPIERDAAIEKLVAAFSPLRLSSLLSDRAALHEHIETRQRVDFERSRLFYVEGWLLTETELCVLSVVRGGVMPTRP